MPKLPLFLNSKLNDAVIAVLRKIGGDGEIDMSQAMMRDLLNLENRPEISIEEESRAIIEDLIKLKNHPQQSMTEKLISLVVNWGFLDSWTLDAFLNNMRGKTMDTTGKQGIMRMQINQWFIAHAEEAGIYKIQVL